MDKRTINLFTQHSRHWRDNRYVYPVVSRRSKGLSIGVNLNPDKICNFDCIYCCVDRTMMPGKVEVDLAVLRDEVDHMVDQVARGALWNEPPFDQTPEHLRRLNDVAFSGDGEPTSFLRFGDACELVARSLQRPGLQNVGDVKIVVITNATLFHQKRVQDALAFIDQNNGEIWAKLDAGTEAYYKQIERTAVSFRQVLDNIMTAGRARPIVIQTLFMRVHDQPPPPSEIAEYVSRLKEFTAGGAKIKLVQIYTTARGTAESYVTPLRRDEVDAIVEQVRGIGLKVEGYYGPE